MTKYSNLSQTPKAIACRARRAAEKMEQGSSSGWRCGSCRSYNLSSEAVCAGCGAPEAGLNIDGRPRTDAGGKDALLARLRGGHK
jgi:hypothetical protein